MNIAEFSINKKVVTITLGIVFIIAGIISYGNLSRLEDPEFSIKQAVVITPYPGATAKEVEEEVTNVIEKACQELGQVWRVESTSKSGMSFVDVIIKDQYDKSMLPQVWDELRRKINDCQQQLPPGAGASLVNDDFGDVYGVYMALSGEGFSYAELYKYADFLKRELLNVTDVKKITLYGNYKEVIYIELSSEKLSQLGISPQEICNTLKSKNIVADSGKIDVGPELITLNPTGEFKSEKQFGDLLINVKEGKVIYLKDIASIKRGYQEPPDTILRATGIPAIGIGISTVSGGNVVRMGEGLKKKLNQLMAKIPLGIDIHEISMQSDSVTEATNGFVINLIESVIIVFVVLFIFMGIKSGLIIGLVLIITILMTLFIMDINHIIMERISLGALIIALGMLVDNAIVITEGMKVQIENGIDKMLSAKQVVEQTIWPLFGATLIAITAFGSIGLSNDSTGEYCRSLFVVILISLSTSWVTAITITPLLCHMFFKSKKTHGHSKNDTYNPYNGFLFRFYKKSLVTALKYRYISVAISALLFTLSIIGFTSLKQMFFPPATRAQFYVDFIFPEGTKIENTAQEIKKAEQYFSGIKDVTSYITMIGGGQIRFLLTYTTEKLNSSFGQIIVSVDDYKKIPEMANKTQIDLDKIFPDATVNVKMFNLGPSKGGKIQLRVSGENHDKVMEIANKAINIISKNDNVKGLYYDWKNKIKVIRPKLLENQAIKLGITRQEIASALESTFSGKKIGIYREKDLLIPIISRSPEKERSKVDDLYNVQVWSPVLNQSIPIRQVISDFSMEFDYNIISRRHRIPTITINFDPKEGLPSELFKKLKPEIEKALEVDIYAVTGKNSNIENDSITENTIPHKFDDRIYLKGLPGYYIAWGGELEDSIKAQNGLKKTLPIFVIIMILIVIFLFNSIKQTAIIWLTVPLSIIGITVGLLLFDQPFGFMAMLGAISLSGMQIKNAIVLIDQINFEYKSGKNYYDSIIDSGVSRIRPVMMAALTTILGMLPLIQDSFFVSMAVTIMFGLGFVSILTLYIVPVFYAIFYNVKKTE